MQTFSVVRQRGEGGAAVVYEAVRPGHRGPVAVKAWRAPLTDRQLEKFRRECELHRRLADHQRIVGLREVHAEPGEPPWLVLDLYEESLADRLARRPLTTAEAFVIADDVLAGLQAVHDAGFLHRDVKPANVLLRRGRAALSDLGMVMELDGHTVDTAGGTPRYVAPELERGTGPTVRSDVWSAARTLRAAFGAKPPADVEKVLTRALSANPADRPADVEELRAKLRAARTRRTPLLLVGAVIAAAAVIAGIVFWPDAETPPLYADDFRGTHTWPTTTDASGAHAYESGGYRITARQRESFVMTEAPFVRPLADEKIEATGTLVSGQGAWGIFCRRTADSPGYTFSLTHAGAVQIRTPTGDPGFVRPGGFDAFEENTLGAECEDTAEGVDLTLSINGTVVAHRLETTDVLAPSGQRGLMVWSFSDVGGPLADATFTSFVVR